MLTRFDDPRPVQALRFPDTGQQVRIFLRDDEPWWVATDVCSVLSIRNSRHALTSLDGDEKDVVTADTPGGPQQVSIVNEPGLYSLILRSRKPEARAFRRWIVHEVLPALRRTGRYETKAAEPTRLELARELVAALEVRELLEQRNAALESSATAWDNLAGESAGDYSLREAAQLLNRVPGIQTGQNRLLVTLRQLGWVDARGNPYQAQVDNGRLVRKVLTYRHPHTHETRLTSQVRITPTGLAALQQRLSDQQTLPRLSCPPA